MTLSLDWIQFYTLLKKLSFFIEDYYQQNIFVSYLFQVKTCNVSLSNAFTNTSLKYILLTLCFPIAADVRLCGNSDKAHLFK